MIRWAFLLCLWAGAALGQVTLDPARASIRDGWWRLELSFSLSDVTPYRVFTLDNPRRLVLDFEAVIFDGLEAEAILSGDRATGLRFGPLRPGWGRMVIDLAEPLVIDQAGMQRSESGAQLDIVLTRATPDEFAQASGAPPDPGWEAATGFDPAVAADIARSGDFVVVIDPGHGGLDPGANRGGIKEADLMLILAQELAVQVNAVDGLRAVLTREGDHFVPLSARLTLARQVGANVFISLHADALEEDIAEGASVYTLSPDGGEEAAQRIVERHERGDLLAGVDLQQASDRVATALMDLARTQTGPQARRLADALAVAMREAGVRMNTRPRRDGQFAVLTAAGFPSILVEAGFLSNPADRAFLASPEGRGRLAQAIVAAVTRLARSG